MNTFSLEEKTVLITGGLGGYGLAICDLILKRKGRVLLADIKPISDAEEILANQFKEAFEAQCSKFGKKCNFKSAKNIIYNFQNGKKSIFAQEKNLELPKMQFSD